MNKVLEEQINSVWRDFADKCSEVIHRHGSDQLKYFEIAGYFEDAKQRIKELEDAVWTK